MSPTIVLDPQGQLLLVVGARGGPRIITSVSQVIVNVIDHHMTYADAMAEPRIHHQAWPDVLHYEPNGLSFATIDTLRTMGHKIEAATFAPGGYVGRVIMIGRVNDGWEASWTLAPAGARRDTSGRHARDGHGRASVRPCYYSLWIWAGAFR